MFKEIICPDPAYEQLKKSGLMDRILSEPVKSTIAHSLLYNSLEDSLDDIGEKLMANSNGEYASVYNELLHCEGDADSDALFHEFESLLKRHPVYLGHLALGEDILKYEEFGFPNRKSLERAITSFCIGERHEFRNYGDNWAWRNNGFKNEISRNEHGDLSVSQMDSSGEDYLDKTLFGDVRIFESMKETTSDGFGLYQDWSSFLGSLLKYSEKIGMSEIPEIANWKETLEEIGGGTSGFYTEAFGGLSGTESYAHMLMYNPLMCDGEELEMRPFLVLNRDSSTLPFFQDGKLLYLRKDENGDIELNTRPFENDRFRKVVEYNSEDLSNAMRATLKYFARSREMIPAIMNEFGRK